MRMRHLCSSIMITITLGFSLINSKAMNSVKSLEIKMAANSGLFIQIVEPHEDHLIDEAVKQYFEPIYDETNAFRYANIIYEELQRYHTNQLHSMNIRLYLVNAKTSVAGVTFMTKSRDYCDIYISTGPNRSEIKERMTLHHEIFHCFDRDDAIVDWASLYETSSYVSKTWGNVGNDAITVDFAGEERAEYYAALLTANSADFEDDPSFDQKKQMILLEAEKLLVDTKNLPPKKTYLLRKWSQGKVASINEVLIDGTLVRQYRVDYATGRLFIYDQTTGKESVIPLQ